MNCKGTEITTERLYLRGRQNCEIISLTGNRTAKYPGLPVFPRIADHLGITVITLLVSSDLRLAIHYESFLISVVEYLVRSYP